MFAKLKKKIAEEAATAPRSGVRIPRTISKESITSMGADSGDDFASDGSSSRDDLPAQLLRRNDQIRKLEAKLSDYAEQLRIMQKTKEKLEIALEKHQDSSIKKLQEQNDSHQASRAKLAEGMALALEKKDQEWMEKMASVEKEKAALSGRIEEMMEQSLALFQKRDDLDELEGFQQQELAKVKHMVRTDRSCSNTLNRELLPEPDCGSVELKAALSFMRLSWIPVSLCREELLLLREEADKKISELEARCQDLQSVIQQVSEDFQKSQSMVSALEKSLHDLQSEHDALKLQQQKVRLVDLRYVDRRNMTWSKWTMRSILNLMGHLIGLCEEDQNGSVTVDDLDHIQKVNRELEQQLSDKNRTIKQLQQRLAELKRTLQKDPSPPTSNTTVTNTSDLNDSREINFEYLKHVVLKFMSCREAEAFQLIRAVSVLLNFTREEEDMLKQTLEYKMSWFGSKPSPKGIIRPSISGTPSHWS
uniref:Golgin subfamily A member 1 n=1 Tax=Salarias fasciatus TaxID=181472 RepID=A0A672HLD6_SALFA